LTVSVLPGTSWRMPTPFCKCGELRDMPGQSHCRKCHNAANKRWRSRNPVKNAVSQAKSRAFHPMDFSKYTAEKSRQLGQPYGTAMHILRKRIMFSLVQRLGLDCCFKCGQRIQTSEDLSIEHKVDWLHSSDPVALFSSLDNIAFSHRSCNKRRR